MITSTSISVTSFERADAIAVQLTSRKDAWVQLGLSERITYLRRCLDRVMAVSEPWAEAACQAKGIEPNS